VGWKQTLLHSKLLECHNSVLYNFVLRNCYVHEKMRSLFSFVIQGDVSVAEEGKKNCSFNLLL
jgi:hypothetical protein